MYTPRGDVFKAVMLLDITGETMGISLPVCEIDPLERSRGLKNSEIAERISAVKKQLGDKLLILGRNSMKCQNC